MARPGRKPKPQRGTRWITKDTVWHVKAKRYIRRRDGKPFKFPVK